MLGALCALCALGGSTARAQRCDTDTTRRRPEPFAFADFTWLNGSSRTKDSPLASSFFTGEFRVDVAYIAHFSRPRDHTLVGSSESGRTGEIQLQHLGLGGDFHCGAARGRLLTQFGVYSAMTPRSDASPARGQWQLSDAYRYLSEAYAGRHWNRMHGINLDAGMFSSYLGLFSYYGFDNWAYQPSYVSSNTPWYFTGLRLQMFPGDRLKIEGWLVNGWQSYGMFNEAPGIGAQVLYRPNQSVSLLSNAYYGYDWLGIAGRWRIHSDNSIQVKYYERRGAWLNRSALSLAVDAGCENGSGVACAGSPTAPQQSFVGFMLYDRSWFARDHFAVTVGGGGMNNPGRYLVILPPINGATASSGTPYFTQGPGDAFSAWDASFTFDFMPDQFTTFRAEANHREASVPYFAGRGGVTPNGGNTATPGAFVSGFVPDLRRAETRLNLALLLKL